MLSNWKIQNDRVESFPKWKTFEASQSLDLQKVNGKKHVADSVIDLCFSFMHVQF